jgi:hypothetical protein
MTFTSFKEKSKNVRRAREQLAIKVLESLSGSDLDEGLKRKLMGGALAAGMAAGALGGGGVRPDVSKAPTAVEAPSKGYNIPSLEVRRAQIAKRKGKDMFASALAKIAKRKERENKKMKDLLGTPNQMRNSAIETPSTGNQPEDMGNTGGNSARNFKNSVRYKLSKEGLDGGNRKFRDLTGPRRKKT